MADTPTLPRINRSYIEPNNRSRSPSETAHNRSMVDIQNSSPAPRVIRRKGTQLSIDDVVRSMKRVNTDFGLDGYQMPDSKAYLNIKRVAAFSKSTSQNDFISQVQKAKAWMPGFKYDVAKPLGNVRKNGFLKGKRVSMTDEIFKRESKIPGPASYSPSPTKPRLIGCYKSSSERDAFIANAQYQAMQTPGAVYEIKTTLTQKRIPEMKYFDNPKERFPKPKRSDSPSPGTYGDEESYKKTQLRRIGNIISKYELPKMSELKVKQHKFVPGVGHYNYEKAIDRVVRSPPPKRRK